MTDIENLQAEQKAIENEMCEKFAEFKVGEVIREVSHSPGCPPHNQWKYPPT